MILPMTSSSPDAESLSISQPIKIGFLLVSTLLGFFAGGFSLFFVIFLCSFTLYRCTQLVEELLAMNKGDHSMIEIADAIREGSTSFFKRVYGTIGKLALPLSCVLFLIYAFRATESKELSSMVTAFIVASTFLLGAGCSTIAGYVGLWVSVRANIRTSAAAKLLVESKGGSPTCIHPVSVALMGGAIASSVVIALVVFGITILFSLLTLLFPNLPTNQVPLLLAGYGFGASFVALFAQLGGGIFTKAADVGADLVGKLEKGIPEDDHRNPAVIADLVGDNVGDCAARGADLFESIAAEIISSMILGGALYSSNPHLMNKNESWGYIVFPLVVHAFDLVVSAIGVFAATRAARGGNADLAPMAILKQGQRVAIFFAIIGLGVATRTFLYLEQLPFAWFFFFLCSLVGVFTGNVSIWIAEYYTDVPYDPVQRIAKASSTGAATNIITGLSVGMTSTGPATVLVGVAVLLSYWIGEASGLTDSKGNLNGGLYGTAVATMGALSSAAYVLTMDIFGPISDNAGGICEMSNQSEAVRAVTDKLDAVGNSTKAATKAFALSTATLACFLLLRAFMDEVKVFSGQEFNSVDLTEPEVFVAGLFGSSMVFVFAGYAINAVGIAAGEVVVEVRRQFREIPGIMENKNKPEYGICVDMVAKSALSLMVKPGLLALASPICVGIFFRFVGWVKNDPLMGPRALVGFLVFNTGTGILLGLFLSNAGGAWDNAKKAVESGQFGGKGSESHSACVVGDTVGDPLKDTAGPSLHVVIKLVSTVVLVLAPFFI